MQRNRDELRRGRSRRGAEQGLDAREHPAREPLVVLGRHRRDLARADRRQHVHPLHRLAVLPVRLDRDPLPQPVGDPVDRENLHHRIDPLARGHRPGCADGLLGLETRQPVGAALAAPGSNPTVEMPTASRAPATVVATPLLIDVAGPYGRFIAAAGPSRT